jgi:DNA-binding MarR family transcriptional regulator
MARRSPGGDAITDLVLKIFRLNGELLAVADEITEGTPLTAARWQVLGAVLPAPLSVADVARQMGLARQSVQRLADLLVEEGLCVYGENPAHRRSKLLAPTALGWDAIKAIRPVQFAWANRVSAVVGRERLDAANDAITALLGVLATRAGRPRTSQFSLEKSR